jgi:filamentous hemagglutinin-like outer membrane protein
VQSTSALAATGNGGNLILGDQHYTAQIYGYSPDFSSIVNCNPGMDSCGSPFDYPFIYADYSATPAFSVIRTGTGNLDLLAGGSFVQHSLYGIYTAGSQAAAVDPIYNPPRANLYFFGLSDGTVLGLPYSDPNVPTQDYAATLADAQAYYPDHGGNLLLSVQGDIRSQSLTNDNARLTLDFNNAGTGTVLPLSADIGNWLWRQGGDIVGQPAAWWINFGSYIQPPNSYGFFGMPVPVLAGFTGIGTLGGGNVTVVAGGNVGNLNGRGKVSNQINVAIASTGRVSLDGKSIDLTGGGNLSVKIAGGLAGGSLTDLRGDIDVSAASVGQFGLVTPSGNSSDPRAVDPLVTTAATGSGAPSILIGDGHVTIDTRGDLAIAGTPDPGRTNPLTTNTFDYIGSDGLPHFSDMGGGQSWFTLWTAATSTDLFAAGGDLTPSQQTGRGDTPPSLRAVAADGNIYFTGSPAGSSNPNTLELAPSPLGQLQLLVGGSIYANGFNIEMSGADPSGLPTPFHPAFYGTPPNDFNASLSNGTTSVQISGPSVNSLYWFEADTPTTALHAGDDAPILVYAAGGDIVNFNTGDSASSSVSNSHWYRGAKPVQIRAARDIVGVGGLIVQNGSNDVSTISAGRDIFYANFDVAGQGLLQILAGRNIYQADKGVLHSIGPLLEADKNSARDTGTGITLIAGVGASGLDYASFAKLYLDPANLADPDPHKPLADQPGKVVKNYDGELDIWLQKTHAKEFSAWLSQQGENDTPLSAYAFFQTLNADQQGIFLRQVYFAELSEAAREHNQVGGPREKSYLRGRDAVAALFPSQAPDGSAISYNGNVTMFGPSGIHADAGGAVQVFTPGGQTLIGVEGQVPPSTAGLITQGKSDIGVYSRGSILLGLSRIMTSFGGNIVAWSAEGDINAGRGSKTTQVFTPPQRTYDLYGNVSLSPAAPTAGAGIATLNPIPEVRPGNVDLIAPLGTIDAGEAGIRVSGNLNLAALQIVNAANISVQGTSSGIPTVQAPNISAALAATNATAATQQTTLPTQTGNNDRPSVIIVEFLGYGGGGDQFSPEENDRRRRPVNEQHSYDPDSRLQVVGLGALSDDEKRELIESQQRESTGR